MLAGPFYPDHPVGHAPRGHPEADFTGEACPKCRYKSSLVGAAGWVWCFSHHHRDHHGGEHDGPPVYDCDYERYDG